MDPVVFSLGVASGLIVGGVGGWFGHSLTMRRTKQDRRLSDQIASLGLAMEIFNARVDYVHSAAFVGGAHSAQANERYLDLWRKQWHARPELLVAPDMWEVWMRAERGAQDKSVPRHDRSEQIKDARITILDWLKDERARLLK
jgi:hypothetical protein